MSKPTETVETPKPRTARVKNPVAIAIDKMTAMLEAMPLAEAGIVMRTITDLHEARYEAAQPNDVP